MEGKLKAVVALGVARRWEGGKGRLGVVWGITEGFAQPHTLPCNWSLLGRGGHGMTREVMLSRR